MAEDTLSIVFVHGFRGDHTSFQSFPTDLHLHLSPQIPNLHTFVYPTYKTTRQLEIARDHFLDWMKTLPPGRVILCGHSMGGLLTAEVAFAAPPNRVIGIMSFDVPFLGVHPHVILSGIASLFKKKEGKSEAEMNNPQHVEMVHKRAGRPYLQDQDSSLSTVGLNPRASSSSVYLTPPEEDSPTPIPAASSSALTPPPLPPRRSNGNIPTLGSGTLTLPPSLHLSSPRPPVRVVSPKIEQAFETFGFGPVPQPVHDVLHFFSKHSGITGVKEWIVQVFEFGGCLLDPRGLIARYERMQQWGSDENAGPYGRGWVNFWTVTVPKRRGGGEIDSGTLDAHVEHENRETDLADAMDLSKIMADGSQSGHSATRAGRALSPTPSISSAGAGSTQPSLLQTISSPLSPSTTLATFETTQSKIPGDNSDFKAAIEELQKQMSKEGISKEEKTALKDKEKSLKSEQKAREKEEKEARKEEERKSKEAAKQAKREKKDRQKALEAAEKRLRDANKVDSPHHFIVLPRKGTDQQWICVPVAGADSEVTAHCGLFFRDENLEYDRLVEDAGNVVRSFWDGKGGTRHPKTPS
ncbi:hypothetical protein BDV93DRAFT_46555 [Ceratobasidium sp. AG-I]|nr:hypothetical protein BDV93DRAFT_46555 [Ceratobasidium sp. AG-I]